MKIAVSIPDDVYRSAERLAEQTNRSRSRLYSDALGEYLARHGTDAVTAGMNETLATVGADAQSRAFVAAASHARFAASDW